MRSDTDAPLRCTSRASDAACIALASLALLGPSRALAWTCGFGSGDPLRAGGLRGRLRAARPLPDRRAAPGLDPERVISEVHRALEAWTQPECTGLRVQYEGRVEGTPTAPLVIEWVPRASSHTITNAGGCIASATLRGNAEFAWNVDGESSRTTDVYRFTLRAAGMAFGLGHSSDRTAVMGSFDTRDTLADDDVVGICSLYPASGWPGRGVCAPCTTDVLCGEGNLCLGYPEGRFCGRACATGECGPGEECREVEPSTWQCVRLFEGEPACSPPLPACTPCESDEECRGGACVEQRPGGGRYCTTICHVPGAPGTARAGWSVRERISPRRS
ncbi:MAG: M10 family metallopeptidase domain-containing protein [Sandaracinaceae bacterium]|nr:M10 family metallopeptidase domain-containing protein [Sandaracinaceae bacterium]